MIFAGILAGGTGTRFGSELPKQFQLLNGKPILFYSLEVFLKHSFIDKIIIAIPSNYISYAKKIIKNNFSTSDLSRINIISGGINRTISTLNICYYILDMQEREQNQTLRLDTILITHDADRPFIKDEMIEDTIIKLGLNSKKYSVVTTAIKTTDTIFDSNQKVTLDRNNLYNIQTPQTFFLWDYVKLFYTLYGLDCLDDNPINKQANKIIVSNHFTDATSVFLKDANKHIGIVLGSNDNIKITTKIDLEIAERLLHNKLLYEQ